MNYPPLFDNARRLTALCTSLLICSSLAIAQEPPTSSTTIPALTRLEEQFTREVGAKVEASFEAGVQRLRNAQQAALEAALKRAASAGQLDDALALKEELKTITEAGTVPENDEAKLNPEVLRLRKAWRVEFGRLQKQRSLALKPLVDAQLLRLRQLEMELTRSMKIEEAKVVREKRESLTKNAGSTVVAWPPSTSPMEARPGGRSTENMDLYASGNNGCIIRINNEEVITVRREKAGKARVGLREGDVIAVRLSDRFDINSFWMSCLSDSGQFLFETSEHWHSYIPADTEKWWIIKDAKKQKPAQFASDKREYVNQVKKSAATTPLYKHTQPICSVLNDGTRIAYVYYVVTKNDLMPKK